MEKKVINPILIHGWGIDADLKDVPNYPIKNNTGDDHKRINWQRPALQQGHGKILMSTERPHLSAVFGTTLPPSGLSGAIRKLGFKYSENMYRHWLALLFADRIDTVESSISDIFHGRIPRPGKERGWGAIGKYRPALLMRKILVRLIVFCAIATLITYYIYKNYNKL
jgi:hypothetical protein